MSTSIRETTGGGSGGDLASDSNSGEGEGDIFNAAGLFIREGLDLEKIRKKVKKYEFLHIK